MVHYLCCVSIARVVPGKQSPRIYSYVWIWGSLYFFGM